MCPPGLGHAFVLPGSSQGAGHLEGEEQNTKPKPQGFSYKLIWFEKGKKKSLKSLLGLNGFFECSYLDGARSQGRGLSKGKKNSKSIRYRMGKLKIRDENISRGFSFLAGFEELIQFL